MNEHVSRPLSGTTRWLGGFSIFFVVCLFFGADGVSQTTTSQSPENQPAEQVFKNIQVLKGMRAADLQGSMSFIAGSLNVDCDYCHTQDFSSDKRQEKVRAREMIQMVRQINQESFHGENRVNCFTCHQGHAEPISLAPIVPRPPRVADASAVAKPIESPLPSVDDVLGHYVQALGGQAALDGVKSRIVKTASLKGGNSNAVMYQKAPGKVLLARESPSYSLWVGFNGQQAWAQDSIKSYWGMLNASQRNAIMRDSEIYQGSRLKTQYTNVQVKGKEKIGEQETYEVSGISPEGTSEEFFFDAQTGLLLRRHIEEQTTFGGFQVQGDFEDYREVGGVKMPFVVRWSSPGGAWGTRTSVKVVDVQQNEPIDDEKFDHPPQIRSDTSRP